MRKIKHFLFSLIMVVVFSCGHNIPETKLSFTEVKHDEYSKGVYNLYFLSNIELISNIHENKLSGPSLKCFVGNMDIPKAKFHSDTLAVLQSLGDIENDTTKTNEKDKYYYVARVAFSKSLNAEGVLTPLTYQETATLLKVLNEKSDCLECIAFAVSHFTFRSAYSSGITCLPVDSITNLDE